MFSSIIAAIALATSAAALALPQGTTGNSGAQPYASTTNITYYSAATFPLNGSGTNECLTPIHTEEIQAGRCYNMSWPGVTVDRVPNGNCILQLYANSETCHGVETKTHTIEQGSTASSCFVPWFGGETKGSGIWTCG